jgi:hypothetical protein
MQSHSFLRGMVAKRLPRVLVNDMAASQYSTPSACLAQLPVQRIQLRAVMEQERTVTPRFSYRWPW